MRSKQSLNDRRQFFGKLLQKMAIVFDKFKVYLTLTLDSNVQHWVGLQNLGLKMPFLIIEIKQYTKNVWAIFSFQIDIFLWNSVKQSTNIVCNYGSRKDLGEINVVILRAKRMKKKLSKVRKPHCLSWISNKSTIKT